MMFKKNKYFILGISTKGWITNIYICINTIYNINKQQKGDYINKYNRKRCFITNENINL